ncbi:MAG: phage holin family protein [Prevotella sp.]|nr:phage holin family protein [Prevotella sp.]
MFSNDRNIETIGQLVEAMKEYIGLQRDYMKLDVVEKVVRLITAITLTVVLSLLIILILIYLSFAAAYALGTVMSQAAAFVIVAAVYLFIFLLLLAFRKQWIERPVVKFLASLLIDKQV